MASRAVVRAGHSPQRFLVRAAVAAPARAAFPLSRSYPLPFRSNSSSTSFPRPLFLLLLLILLLLLEDAGAQQGDGCGHTVLGPESGTLTSINYPHTYPNSTVCEWEIRVKTGERVRIKFGDFDIEDSDSCHFNYLRIYNGIGVGRTEIGKYCGLGLQMNHSIESKSNEVTVLFMSGIHVSGRGFLASYSVIEKQGWWKGMKQFLPAKSVEHEETPVRYSSSEVNHLSPREVPTMLQADSAEYAQPLVGGIVGPLHQRSTFKPEEGKEAGYADLDPYSSPMQEVYHAYAEPLPVTGPEYATPIVMDMSGHPSAAAGLPSTSTFKAAGNQPPPSVGTYNTLLSRTDSCSSAQAQYDTPKGGKPGPSAPDELVYQVPQSTQEVSEAGREGECDVFKEVL